MWRYAVLCSFICAHYAKTITTLRTYTVMHYELCRGSSTHVCHIRGCAGLSMHRSRFGFFAGAGFGTAAAAAATVSGTDATTCFRTAATCLLIDFYKESHCEFSNVAAANNSL